MISRFLSILYLLLTTSFLYAGPYIVIKMDDIYVKKGKSPVLPVLDFLKERQIKASIGMIASLSDTTILSVLTPYMEATDKKGKPLLEIWNHGYDHRKPEFKGMPYDYQKKHFNDATTQIESLLNITIETFGAPFNAIDSITGQIITENTNYKTIFLADRNLMNRPDIICLNNVSSK